MSNLLELAPLALKVFGEVEDYAADHEGVLDEMPQELAARADAIQAELERKYEALAQVVRLYELTAKAQAEEAARLAEAKRRSENKARFLKQYMLTGLKLANIKRVTAGPYTVGVAANGGVVPLVVPESPVDVPPEYHKTIIEIDKAKVRAALEAGQQVPGCRLAERGERLTIR